MYYIAELAEQYNGKFETIMEIILNLLDKKTFKNMSLYKGTDHYTITETILEQVNEYIFAQPDVSYEYFRFDNGKAKLDLHTCNRYLYLYFRIWSRLEGKR